MDYLGVDEWGTDGKESIIKCVLTTKDIGVES
jgi:hypothetical protein